MQRRRVFQAVLSGLLLPQPSSLSASLGQQGSWDDTWTTALRSGHRVVIDCADFQPQAPTVAASSILRTYHEALGADAAVKIVMVVRHRAIPLVLNDALWANQEIGRSFGIADPVTGRPALRNIYLNKAMGDSTSGLASLQQRGGVVLVCNAALRNFAMGKTAEQTRMLQEKLRAGLIPGAILQPDGKYALLRAQEVGCVLYRE